MNLLKILLFHTLIRRLNRLERWRCFLPRGALIIAVEDWCMESLEFLSNFNRDFLKLPLRFLGVGTSPCCCKIITLSSRWSRSNSRSANSASRCFKRSSTIFCSRCLSSKTASLLRSSYYKRIKISKRLFLLSKIQFWWISIFTPKLTSSRNLMSVSISSISTFQSSCIE